MSFVNTRLSLPKTNVALHKFKDCDKCKQPRAPEGGVDMGSRWICANCWTLRAVRPKNRG